MIINYNDSNNTTNNTNNTITVKEAKPMLNDIKALSPGEWAYLGVFAAIVVVACIVANYTY